MFCLHFVDKIAAASFGLHNDTTETVESFVSNPNLANTEINTATVLTGEYWDLVPSNINPHYPNKALQVVYDIILC